MYSSKARPSTAMLTIWFPPLNSPERHTTTHFYRIVQSGIGCAPRGEQDRNTSITRTSVSRRCLRKFCSNYSQKPNHLQNPADKANGRIQDFCWQPRRKWEARATTSSRIDITQHTDPGGVQRISTPTSKAHYVYLANAGLRWETKSNRWNNKSVITQWLLCWTSNCPSLIL